MSVLKVGWYSGELKAIGEPLVIIVKSWTIMIDYDYHDLWSLAVSFVIPGISLLCFLLVDSLVLRFWNSIRIYQWIERHLIGITPSWYSFVITGVRNDIVIHFPFSSYSRPRIIMITLSSAIETSNRSLLNWKN